MSASASLHRSMELQLEVLRELRRALQRSERAESRPLGPRGPCDAERRVLTIAQRARASILSRLLEILGELLSLEKELLSAEPRRRTDSLRLKDSIELKNISLRLAFRDLGSQCHRDLKELRDCLKCIVVSLVSSQNDQNHKLCLLTEKLRQIITTFPDF
ncbi:leukemia-associated protein 7 [Scleropages formosus]|uniref:Deleted in lymphocytic leukemia 7 n=1 Tax=Scleropages formosus TaxID=113540 RepID=A0A8C9RP76_SCLFO|nr:leukemia-associated protein 7 [Scleropages formosus]